MLFIPKRLERLLVRPFPKCTERIIGSQELTFLKSLESFCTPHFQTKPTCLLHHAVALAAC